MRVSRETAAPSEGESALLDLLRAKGLSIKNLSRQNRLELRDLMARLHNDRGLSLTDIALLIGNKTSGYTSWLCRQLGVPVRDFETARLKGIREKRRKYERLPFDGTDADKAYMLGLRHGDLSVSRPWKGVVRVSTSTTHPAMSELFEQVFGRYAHIYRYARYKKDTSSYEWNLSAILDGSFGFLCENLKVSWVWVNESRERKLHYLGGLFDAEGSVGLYRSSTSTALTVCYYNTNLAMMRFVHKTITGLGFHPLPPYLDKRKGFRSPGFHIEMKKDYWRILVASFDEAQSFLRNLPVRHREKAMKAQLAVSLEHRQRWCQVGRVVDSIRKEIRSERNKFVGEAKRVVARREEPKVR